MTLDEVRTLALREFAALTRHPPGLLSDKFELSMTGEEVLTINVKFGKRHASTECDPQLLEDAERLTAEVLKPLALELYTSV